MKIAYLTTAFPSTTGTFVFNEVAAHDEEGVDVLALACEPPLADEALSEAAQAWLHRTVVPFSAAARLAAVVREVVRQPVVMLINVVWLLRLLFVDPVECLKGISTFGTAAYFAHACRKHGTELIHVHFASRPLSCGIMLSRLVHVPVSCTVHAFELWGRSGRNLRYRLRSCRRVVTISQYNVDYIRRKCGREIADLCRVVHCGINLLEFDASNRMPVLGRIVLISQMTEKKGHRYLVDACALLKQRGIGHECLIMGTGPEYVSIEQQIRELGIGDTVKLLGALPNDQIRPYLNSAAVFALPSVVASSGDQDGIPVSLMEAMACGVPVISTTVSGIPELLRNGEAGCLVPDRDVKALADALQRLLADKALAERYALAGRKAVQEEFDIRVTTQQLRTLFAEMIDSDKRP